MPDGGCILTRSRKLVLSSSLVELGERLYYKYFGDFFFQIYGFATQRGRLSFGTIRIPKFRYSMKVGSK